MNAWKYIIDIPVEGRIVKPRSEGITMVIDKGLGFNQIEDLIQVA